MTTKEQTKVEKTAEDTSHSTLSRIKKERAEKAQKIRVLGLNPYANDFKPSALVSDFTSQFHNKSRDDLLENDQKFVMAGRVMSMRNMGKAAFLRLKDVSGDIQLFLQKNQMGDQFDFLKLVDVGDIVGVSGTPMRTKTDELSLKLDTLKILTKSINPLPEKWHGLTNVEQRHRQRYLDLIANKETQTIFQKRSLLIREMRKFLDDKGYLEVETPILSDISGGATARPFETHHNALGEDLTLRIATELHLKRLVVGGFHKVYEIGRIFRNEGVSTVHNPEFTSIEFYQAFADYEDLMNLTEEMLKTLVQKVCGDLKITYQGNKLDFSKPIRRVSIPEMVAQHFGFDKKKTDELVNITSVEQAMKVAGGFLVSFEEPVKICLHELSDEEACDFLSLKTPQGQKNSIEEQALSKLKNTGDKYYAELGKLLDEKLKDSPVRRRRLALHLLYGIFDHLIEETIVEPTFLTGFSASVSPLARSRDDDPAMVDRFEMFCCGMELANAFSELSDPEEQKRRFEIQAKRKEKGDHEAHEVDHDFLTALETGMPPTAGEGIGIDRLAMILTDSPSIREVILFPKLRSHKGTSKK